MNQDNGWRREAQAANARAFAATLAARGVGPVVISPGSRSTPLVLACAEHPDLETLSVIDERSAAFFALGWSRATGRPAVLLCTSGSAAGHYLPAIMEADQAELPMLVVTANRPIEREASGAPQTAVQRHLYSHVVRLDLEVDLALDSERGAGAVRRVVAQAVARSVGPVPGPVHVDVRIRRPLEPQEWPAPPPRNAETPRWHMGRWTVDDQGLGEVVALVANARRPMVVAGPAPRWAADAAESAASLSSRSLPIFGEWTSQLRAQGEFWALGAGLQSARVREEIEPDLVVQLGTAPVSSGWEPWIERCVARGARHVVVQSGRMRDARSTATDVVVVDPALLLQRLGARLPAGTERRWSRWRDELTKLHGAIAAVLEREWNASGLELQAARAAICEAPSGVLGFGNSLAIRHAEGVPASHPGASSWSWVWHQRGLSGIDGLLAGMAGSLRAVAERGRAQPARLILGDVSFVHDLGSLGLLRASWAERLDVVVLDNGGGRIFERLPLERLALDEATRNLFATPIGVDLAKAVGAWGLDYHEIFDLEGLVARLHTASRGARVLHVRCPGAEVTADHQRILAALDRVP